MGTKWRGSAGSAGSKGYLIPIKSADLDAEPRQAVISGCLADLYASAPLLDVWRDKLCKVAHVSLAAAAAAEDSYQKIIFSTGKHFKQGCMGCHVVPCPVVSYRILSRGNESPTVLA